MKQGRACPEIFVRAIESYRLAILLGSIRSPKRLTAIYAKGIGVPTGFNKLARWFQRATVQEDAMAQFKLSQLYRPRQGADRDAAELASRYKLAAERGQAHAQNSLGVMYEMGLGVSINKKQALRLYRLAAEQGLAHAEGFGAPQDLVQAYFWLSRSASNGLKLALEWRQKIENKMSVRQLARVKLRQE